MRNQEPIADGAITANFKKRKERQGEEEDGLERLGLEAEQQRSDKVAWEVRIRLD